MPWYVTTHYRDTIWPLILQSLVNLFTLTCPSACMHSSQSKSVALSGQRYFQNNERHDCDNPTWRSYIEKYNSATFPHCWIMSFGRVLLPETRFGIVCLSMRLLIGLNHNHIFFHDLQISRERYMFPDHFPVSISHVKQALTKRCQYTCVVHALTMWKSWRHLTLFFRE